MYTFSCSNIMQHTDQNIPSVICIAIITLSSGICVLSKSGQWHNISRLITLTRSYNNIWCSLHQKVREARILHFYLESSPTFTVCWSGSNLFVSHNLTHLAWSAYSAKRTEQVWSDLFRICLIYYSILQYRHDRHQPWPMTFNII